MTRRVVCLIAAALTLGAVLPAKDRAWQTGTWREVRVTRPKVVFGIRPDPFANGRGQASMTEIRTYVIETDYVRLELKDTTTSDAPSLGAVAGEPVTFAIEKDTAYIKDEKGREHALHVTRKSSKP